MLEELHYFANQVDQPQTRDLVPLYMPGNVIHVISQEETHSSCCSGSSSKEYSPMFVPNNKAIDEFVLSSRMLAEHFPNYVFSTNLSLDDRYFDGSRGSVTSRVPSGVFSSVVQRAKPDESGAEEANPPYEV